MATGKKTGGRRKGTPNKSTGAVADRCRQLIESKAYQAFFKQRLERGELPPAVEAMTWHYAYGKPKESLELTGAEGGPVRVEFVIVDAHA